MTQEAAVTAMISHPTPILRVRDVDASVAYYTGPLGFKLDWRAPNADFAAVSRDKCKFFLTASDQGHAGTWVWIGVADVAPLHAEWVAAGALVRQGPTNFPWGSLEIQVSDPDGHVFRFASDGIPGMPFGPWMDSEGKLWPFG